MKEIMIRYSCKHFSPNTTAKIQGSLHLMQRPLLVFPEYYSMGKMLFIADPYTGLLIHSMHDIILLYIQDLIICL